MIQYAFVYLYILLKKNNRIIGDYYLKFIRYIGINFSKLKVLIRLKILLVANSIRNNSILLQKPSSKVNAIVIARR